MEEDLFGFLVFSSRSKSNTEVPVEIIIVEEVTLDGLEIDKDIVKLLENEEATGHALSSRDGVTLSGGGSHQLVQFLSNIEVVLRLFLHSDDCMNHSLDDVFLGDDWFHIFDQFICFLDIVILQMVDDEVESGFGHNVEEGREHLSGILSSSEDNQVVSEKIIVFKHISSGGVLLQHFQLCFSCFPVVKLIVIASLQIDSSDGVRVDTEIDSKDLEGYIIVVKFVVTKSHIHIEGMEVSLVKEKILVDLSSLFIMISEIMEGSQA